MSEKRFRTRSQWHNSRLAVYTAPFLLLTGVFVGVTTGRYFLLIVLGSLVLLALFIGILRDRTARGLYIVAADSLILVRGRDRLTIPAAEIIDASLVDRTAFTGAPEKAEWLDQAAVDALMEAAPDANVAADQAVDLTDRVVGALPSLAGSLEAEADRLAAELLDAHRRVRAGAGAARRGLAVTAQKPVDVLGVYVWLPVSQ